jgi:TolB-like protein/class 3 adenylate cyclase/Tfp pilus assembly protein PilF
MQEATEKRRLAAIMFTDMVGYSALTQRNEALALELLQEHRRLLRDSFRKFHGREIQTTGDGFLVEFVSALEAVKSALEIQHTLAERNATSSAERRVQVRIGIHVGDIIVKRDQVLGDGVNIAARLEPLAKAGGICVSSAVFEQIHNKVAESFISMGMVNLKNLARPMEVFQVQMPNEGSATAAAGPAISNASAGEHSIAVLPFVNMSDDRENEFLSDGITEDLITVLSQVKSLRVPARTSAFVFKNKNEDIRRIGQLLNVRHVLEGSVRKAGQRLRITAQLVSVMDGFHLWSQRFDREMVDVFAIQDEIARAIGDALKLELATEPGTPRVKAPTSSTAAYQLYLQGRNAFYERGHGLRKAYHYFELAILEDPQYALAYSGLADTYFLLSFYGFISSAQAIPKALVASEKAVQLSPNSAESRVSLATVKGWCGWEFDAALGLYREAFELSPRYPQGRAWYGSFLSAMGRHAEALEQHRCALDLDPLSPYLNSICGWGLIHAGRFEEALAQLQRAIELAPDYPLAHRLLGQTYVCLGQMQQGIDELTHAVTLARRAAWVLAYLGYALARKGQRDDALRVLEELSDPARQAQLNSRSLAVVHAGLGDTEAALKHLEMAYEERDVQLPWINIEPAFAGLRSEPRFLALQRKVGLPELHGNT